MPNHPNRGPKGPSAGPSTAAIIAAREAAGLTQVRAAELIHGTRRGWQEYEAGNRRMHPGLWWAWQAKWALANGATADDLNNIDARK